MWSCHLVEFCALKQLGETLRRFPVGVDQGSATFYALRTGFSLALFCGPALNKIMNVWHMQIYYNS